MHNTFRAILAMTTFLVTGALSSCNHTDELEPESPAPQIVFLFSPGGLGDMSYNDRILEGVQRFKMENGDIDIYIYSPESLQEAEKIFADWLERPQSSIPVLFVLGSSDYEPMAELYLAEHDLTPNKSILLFESRKQYKDENIHTFQISMFGASYIIRKTKCFDFWERNVLFPKTKRSFFRTPKHPLPCPFPLNFSLLIITKKFGNLAKNRYICIV